MHEPSWRFRAIIHAGFVNVTPLMAWQWIVPWRSQWLQIFFFTRIVPLTWPFGSWMPAGMIFCILQAALRSKHYTEVTFHCETAREFATCCYGKPSTWAQNLIRNPVFWRTQWHHDLFTSVCTKTKYLVIALAALESVIAEQGRSGGKKFPTFVTTSRKIVWNILGILGRKNDIACLICLVRSSCC